jgi:hypothetical protein
MSKRSTCQFCDERPSQLPNGSCRECAMDNELDQLLVGATKRAFKLGINFDRFIELCECAMNVVDLDLPAMMASADVDRLKNNPKSWMS